MTAIHTSRNLRIDYDSETEQYVVTVLFHDESIVGYAPAPCPRCGGRSHLTLWELEGPGSVVNTVWLVCASEPPCMLDNEPLRWSRPVVFEDDWSDV
jgi:hypothetical protein